MTIQEFLQTEEAKKAMLKTDFTMCRADDRVHTVLRQMDNAGVEWMGMLDDAYLMGGVRREDLVRAIEEKKPEERFEVENSPVEPYSYALTVVAKLTDDAAEIGRRLVVSQQPDLVVIDSEQKPVAVMPATALIEYSSLSEEVQRPLRR